MAKNLYDYISKSENLKLSDLSEKDMNTLLYLIAQTPIEYKDKLNFSSKYQFGVEIEFENACFEAVEKDMIQSFKTVQIEPNEGEKNYDHWIIEQEGNCSSYNSNYQICGGEINTPISTNSKEFWNSLKQVCAILKKHSAEFNEMAGLHIHLNKQILLPKISRWLKLLKTWIIFEDEYIKIYNGERYHQRTNAQTYAKDYKSELYNHMFYTHLAKYKTITQIQNKLKMCDINRNHNLVFYTPRVCNKTFELRACNSTNDEIIIQQFINIYVSMFKMINNEKSDAFIDELFNDFENERLFIYPEILYKLLDEMFDTIEDKASCLRLYYKDTRYTPLTK